MEMYKRVLEDNLEFPSRFDPVTCSFLTGVSKLSRFIKKNILRVHFFIVAFRKRSLRKIRLGRRWY